MVALLERVRVLLQAGAPIQVSLFQPEYTSGMTGAGYEQAMADTLTRDLDEGRLTLALVGNMHARKSPAEHVPGHSPMATRLRLPTVAITTGWPGGTAWNCTKDRPTAELVCGPSPMTGEPTPRGVTLYREVRDGADGEFSVGTPFSASPPARRVTPD